MKRAFDRICHSLSFLPFFPPPSIDNQWNDWGKPRGKGGKKGGIGNGKKKERSRDGMTEARWGLKRHRLFSLDLYHGKMKILFRLYSFTGYIQQGPFKSFDEPSIFIRFGHAFRARAHTHIHVQRRKWVITGNISGGNACPRNGTFHSSNGDNIVPESEGLGCSLFFLFFSSLSLFPCFSHLEQWNLKYGNGTLLAFPLLSPLFFRNVDKIAVVCYFNELLLLN